MSCCTYTNVCPAKTNSPDMKNYLHKLPWNIEHVLHAHSVEGQSFQHKLESAKYKVSTEV